MTWQDNSPARSSTGLIKAYATNKKINGGYADEEDTLPDIFGFSTCCDGSL